MKNIPEIGDLIVTPIAISGKGFEKGIVNSLIAFLCCKTYKGTYMLTTVPGVMGNNWVANDYKYPGLKVFCHDKEIFENTIALKIIGIAKNGNAVFVSQVRAETEDIESEVLEKYYGIKPNSFFVIHWLDGTKEVVEGINEKDAFTKAGYGNGAVKAVDFFTNGKTSMYKWDGDAHRWVDILGFKHE